MKKIIALIRRLVGAQGRQPKSTQGMQSDQLIVSWESGIWSFERRYADPSETVGRVEFSVRISEDNQQGLVSLRDLPWWFADSYIGEIIAAVKKHYSLTTVTWCEPGDALMLVA